MKQGRIIKNEKKHLILLSAIVLYYAIIKIVGAGFIYQSYVTMLFWGVLYAYVHFSGNVRAHSKLKHKEFYIFYMIVCACLYILSYFVFGFIDGIGANIYDTSLMGAAKNILTLGSVLVLRELIRNHIINAVEKKNAVSFGILIIVIFSITEINFGAIFELGSMEEVLTFLSASVLPLLLFNAFMTYAAYTAGAWGAVIYSLVTHVPLWVVGVLPNLRWITMLLVGALLPLLCLIVLRNIKNSKDIRGKAHAKKEGNPYSWIAVAMVMVGMVWFALGIFPISPSIIVSNSMNPVVSKGDLVFIQRTDTESLEVGDVIQYKLEDIHVFHRIIDIKYSAGIQYFVTKGDANNSEDPNPVMQTQVMGRYAGRIPYIGWPALVLRQESAETRVETGSDDQTASADADKIEILAG